MPNGAVYSPPKLVDILLRLVYLTDIKDILTLREPFESVSVEFTTYKSYLERVWNHVPLRSVLEIVSISSLSLHVCVADATDAIVTVKLLQTPAAKDSLTISMIKEISTESRFDVRSQSPQRLDDTLTPVPFQVYYSALHTMAHGMIVPPSHFTSLYLYFLRSYSIVPISSIYFPTSEEKQSALVLLKTALAAFITRAEQSVDHDLVHNRALPRFAGNKDDDILSRFSALDFKFKTVSQFRNEMTILRECQQTIGQSSGTTVDIFPLARQVRHQYLTLQVHPYNSTITDQSIPCTVPHFLRLLI